MGGCTTAAVTIGGLGGTTCCNRAPVFPPLKFVGTLQVGFGDFTKYTLHLPISAPINDLGVIRNSPFFTLDWDSVEEIGNSIAIAGVVTGGRDGPRGITGGFAYGEDGTGAIITGEGGDLSTDGDDCDGGVVGLIIDETMGIRGAIRGDLSIGGIKTGGIKMDGSLTVNKPSNIGHGHKHIQKPCRENASLKTGKENISIEMTATDNYGYLLHALGILIQFVGKAKTTISEEETILVLVYVDNMLITGSSLKLIEDTKKALQQAFKMKDCA
uniref:Reverse transcriptase Ty1/copia-type domain-containing protein n=1 Tax=Solanum lycopersicum TaxID=4081 RepID=A0A3Q7F3W9_SOLLC